MKPPSQKKRAHFMTWFSQEPSLVFTRWQPGLVETFHPSPPSPSASLVRLLLLRLAEVLLVQGVDGLRPVGAFGSIFFREGEGAWESVDVGRGAKTFENLSGVVDLDFSHQTTKSNNVNGFPTTTMRGCVKVGGPPKWWLSSLWFLHFLSCGPHLLFSTPGDSWGGVEHPSELPKLGLIQLGSTLHQPQNNKP